MADVMIDLLAAAAASIEFARSLCVVSSWAVLGNCYGSVNHTLYFCSRAMCVVLLMRPLMWGVKTLDLSTADR